MIEWLAALVAPLNLALFHLGSDAVSRAEALGFVTGGLCVWLTVRGHIANFGVGIANSGFFLVLFASSRLWADSALQIVFIALGVIGSGYIAAVIPHEVITGWLGPDSGWLGVLTAVIAGAATPGGPVVGFSIGAVALKVGGGPPQVIAYVVAWALFAFQRLILWEIPFMPARFVWFRAAVSLPFPFLAAALAMAIGKP